MWTLSRLSTLVTVCYGGRAPLVRRSRSPSLQRCQGQPRGGENLLEEGGFRSRLGQKIEEPIFLRPF